MVVAIFCQSALTVVAICSVLWLLFVEDQVMVTEFKDEDPDPPMNAATGTPKDYTKQSYEDQESDPPVDCSSRNFNRSQSSVNAVADERLELIEEDMIL